MNKFVKLFHLKGIRRVINLFFINHVFSGTNPKFFEIKRKLLISLGYDIGENTKIVAPVELNGSLTIGKNCWIGKNFKVNGNGFVCIGDNCDIAPEVTFQTGGHVIGDASRRAGNGVKFSQNVGNGTWIGGRVTILNNTTIGNSCVVAGCACVTKNVDDNTLVGGVPARLIRELT